MDASVTNPANPGTDHALCLPCSAGGQGDLSPMHSEQPRGLSPFLGDCPRFLAPLAMGVAMHAVTRRMGALGLIANATAVLPSLRTLFSTPDTEDRQKAALDLALIAVELSVGIATALLFRNSAALALTAVSASTAAAGFLRARFVHEQSSKDALVAAAIACGTVLILGAVTTRPSSPATDPLIITSEQRLPFRLGDSIRLRLGRRTLSIRADNQMREKQGISCTISADGPFAVTIFGFRKRTFDLNGTRPWNLGIKRGDRFVIAADDVALHCQVSRHNSDLLIISPYDRTRSAARAVAGTSPLIRSIGRPPAAAPSASQPMTRTITLTDDGVQRAPFPAIGDTAVVTIGGTARQFTIRRIPLQGTARPDDIWFNISSASQFEVRTRGGLQYVNHWGFHGRRGATLEIEADAGRGNLSMKILTTPDVTLALQHVS